MIRKATMADLPEIIHLGRRMHEESSYNSMGFASDRVANMSALLIEHGFAMVVEIDGNVVGGMLGDVVTPWYTNERMGNDIALYIAPEHRKGTAAMKLLKKFEEWCLLMGAKHIRPGVSTGSTEAGRLYKARGYKVVGECFLKEL